MNVSRLRRALVACATAGLAALAVSAFASTAASVAATVTPVASGLDNPRGLSFGPDGRLYVAEAGNGGEEACLPPEQAGEEPFCIGFTGGIGAIDVSSGNHRRVVSNLVSFAGKGGFGATGIDGVSAHGNGGIFGIITESHPGLERLGFPLSAQALARAQEQVGRLIQANPSGHWKAVANVGDVDFRWTEEHFKELGVEQPPDSNAYGVFATGGERWVADSAANVIDEVRPNGSVKVAAFIPSPPVSDSVPTCLDRGRDGALYIGELTGFGNGPGKSVVWRLVPGQKPQEWATGLTGVTGCGFGSDGQFYATEFSTAGWESGGPGTGAVVRVPPHSTSPALIASGLSFPGGFAAGSNGAIYVSNWSVAPANSGGGPTGEVVRITP
jgi:hypothetical protein